MRITKITLMTPCTDPYCPTVRYQSSELLDVTRSLENLLCRLEFPDELSARHAVQETWDICRDLVNSGKFTDSVIGELGFSSD